jgi:hypothetical protein
MTATDTVTDLIDYETILRDLDEIVKGREDYVYRRDHEFCVYKEPGGAPSCLVGHVLARHGLLDAVFEHSTIADPDCQNRDVMDAFTHDALQALDVAQSVQDGGLDPHYNSWGHAVQAAREYLDDED